MYEGTGYIGGESPNGLTTFEGLPISAIVMVFHHDTHDFIKSTQSNTDGTWMIEGLDHTQYYDIQGRFSDKNDVIVSNIKPINSKVISIDGSIVTNDKTNSIIGSIVIVGGMPPYTLSVDNRLPMGITSSLNNRDISFTGETTDIVYLDDFYLDITDKNSVTGRFLFKLVFGLYVDNIKSSYTNQSVNLSWDAPSYVDRFDIYRSESKIDENNLPPIYATSTQPSFIDSGVIVDKGYYYRIAAVKLNNKAISYDHLIYTTAQFMQTLLFDRFTMYNNSDFYFSDDKTIAHFGSVGDWNTVAMGTPRTVSNGESYFYEVFIMPSSKVASAVMIGVAYDPDGLAGGGRSYSFQYFSNGNKRSDYSYAPYGKPFSIGDAIGVLIKPVNGNCVVEFFVNGVSQGDAFILPITQKITPIISVYNDNSANWIDFELKRIVLFASAPNAMRW